MEVFKVNNFSVHTTVSHPVSYSQVYVHECFLSFGTGVSQQNMKYQKEEMLRLKNDMIFGIHGKGIRNQHYAWQIKVIY